MGIVFPPAPKRCTVQPIRWQHGPAHHTSRLLVTYIQLNARQNYSSAYNSRATLAPPTRAGSHCLLLAHVLAFPSDYVGESGVVLVSCVTIVKLSSPGSSMSATNRGRACMRACISHLNWLVSPFSRYDTGVGCISGAELF